MSWTRTIVTSPLFSSSIHAFFLLLSTYPQHNDVREGMDINVTGVWEHNITGTGVTVVVVDDGVQHTLQDIQPNYVSFMLATSRPISF
jgi:hypothetical protein